VTSGTFATVGNHAVSNVALAVSNTAPNATGVTYTTTFNTSSTGGLDGLSGSFITAHYLPGTDFTASSMTVRDTTTNTVVGSCSDTANVLECLLFFSETIGPFDAVEVKATNVKNTSDGAVGAVATVSTSSDVGTTVDTATPTPTATATPSPTATATTPTPTATSSPGLPVAVADKPVVKSTTSLTLSAVVNPMGLPTTMHFEYGTSAGTVGRAVTFLKTPDQDVGSDNVPHTVTATVNGLLPNSDYQVRAVAVNSAGTQVSDPQTVSTPADPPPPPPKLGETFNIEPVSGVVLVKGANGQLVPLTEASQIVPGALIDARKGELSLTTSAVGGKKKKLQKGNFKRGLFTVRQFKKSKLKGLVDLRLALRDTSGIPLTKGCNQRRDALLGTTAKKPKKVLNTLQSDAKGSFRTTGKYSAATVRGTKWDVADRCDGTLTTVHRGVVSVEDFTKRKTVNVRAGKSYFAAAKA
jgi:hypothetical protein